ncbi:hypothetical protein PAPHI01_0993 [Pancytospora philotis]|nr:hypothetical protein PAPHI01_0993 [Pancytospora philotis]
MDGRDTTRRLPLPLSTRLVEHIMQRQPELGSFIVSVLEFTIKESSDHYADAFGALETILKGGAANFLAELFAVAEQHSGAQSSVNAQPAWHAGGTSVRNSPRRTSVDHTFARPGKNLNREVVFNRVNEDAHTLQDLQGYAEKYGAVDSIRRLNRGKYLVVFAVPEDAQRLVESYSHVLADPAIKKFYNVMGAGPDASKRVDICALLQEQRDLLYKLTDACDAPLAAALKRVTQRIRDYILAKDARPENKMFRRAPRPPGADGGVEASIYYNLFKN